MIINSILDSDLYKVTQQQAVCQLYPHAQARYKFINRGKTTFRRGFDDAVYEQVYQMAKLQLGQQEAEWLAKTCPFLTPVFIDFLKGYKYNPDEVKIYQNDEKFEVTITGPWYRSILWEVPLMAIISELHFKFQKLGDTSLSDSYSKTAIKGKKMLKAGVKFADFGTRRRYSQRHHDTTISYLIDSAKEALVGSSNMQIAMNYNLKPIGTQAHEWIMFHGAKYGYRDANRMAMKKWVDVFHGNLGIALSDTFTTDVFLKAFGLEYAKLFDGVRQDSGDPFVFAEKIVDHYKRLGIDPMSKTIVFSDSLNPTRAIQLHTLCEDIGIKCSFGIGTNLTNDIKGVEPLNMVIKMTHCKPYGECAWLPVVKLSDTSGKHTGEAEEVALCKKLFKIS